MKRTAISTGELERVEVMGRVALKLTDAATMLPLSYRQVKTLVAAVWAGGQARAEAWECRPALESQQATETSTTGAEFNQEKILRFGEGAIRADVDGRALGRRRRHCDGSRHFTALDVAGRAMEPAANAQETLPTMREVDRL